MDSTIPQQTLPRRNKPPLLHLTATPEQINQLQIQQQHIPTYIQTRPPSSAHLILREQGFGKLLEEHPISPREELAHPLRVRHPRPVRGVQHQVRHLSPRELSGPRQLYQLPTVVQVLLQSPWKVGGGLGLWVEVRGKWWGLQQYLGRLDGRQQPSCDRRETKNSHGAAVGSGECVANSLPPNTSGDSGTRSSSASSSSSSSSRASSRSRSKEEGQARGQMRADRGTFRRSRLSSTHRVVDDRHQHLRDVARIDGLDQVVPVVHLRGKVKQGKARQGRPEDTRAKKVDGGGARVLRQGERRHGPAGARSANYLSRRRRGLGASACDKTKEKDGESDF